MDLSKLLGDEAESLLTHESKTIPREDLILPGPDFVDRVVAETDRTPPVLRNLQHVFDHGRLGGTGYLSILPVDQGIEHSGASSFAKNPSYFDPRKLLDLANWGPSMRAALAEEVAELLVNWPADCPMEMRAACEAVLARTAREVDEDARTRLRTKLRIELGAVGIGATIYFGSEESSRQIQEVSEAFSEAHDLGMFTVLWCYVRNSAFKKDGVDYSVSADLTGQANHLGVTIQADIIKQKQPENNGGFTALNFGRTDPLVYSELTTENPIDLARWQVANCYMGRVPLINSGGESKGEGDLGQAVRTAVINKRAGGTGLIVGRKAFQRPMSDGVELLRAVQDVFLDKNITVA